MTGPKLKLASSTPKFGTNPRVKMFKANPMKNTFVIQSKISDNDHTETDIVLLATTIDAAFAVIKN